MPEYGEKKYWDDRYSTSENDPFDWLCDWEQLGPTITPLIRESTSFLKSEHAEELPNEPPRILCVGCGNAPFSAEMQYMGGFTNIINIDYSEIVIIQQKQKWPNLAWVVMDALDMDFADNEFDIIIDKSLIDTTMCYKNGREATYQLFSEMHRVLKPGGRLICVSLHAENEVLPFGKLRSKEEDFMVTTCKLYNQRRRDCENNSSTKDPRVLYHTFVVFDKVHGLDKEEKEKLKALHPLDIVNAVPQDEVDETTRLYEAEMNGVSDENKNCSTTDEKKLESYQDDATVEHLLNNIVISEENR